MVKKMFVEVKESKDSKKIYHALVVDFGYRTESLFIDKGLMSELCGITAEKLYTSKVGDTFPVAFNLEK